VSKEGTSVCAHSGRKTPGRCSRSSNQDSALPVMKPLCRIRSLSTGADRFAKENTFYLNEFPTFLSENKKKKFFPQNLTNDYEKMTSSRLLYLLLRRRCRM